MSLKVAIASDHAGYPLKTFLIENFKAIDVEWVDLGTDSTESVDYPDFGYKLADVVAAGDVEYGVAVCGTGIGISIAANRNVKIRAANCTDTTMARLTRLHNNANILGLGDRLIGTEVAMDILKAFLETKFEGGRHARRVEKLST